MALKSIDSQPPRPVGSGTDASERELLERIARSKDQAAFRTLYTTYYQRLSRLLARMSVRREDIEEVINDTFWVVWKKAGDFRGDSQPSTWILGIAYRRARNAFRSLARAGSTENLDMLPELPTSDEPLRAAELRDWIVRALERIPLEQRLAVELCYELGYSCEEIATIMGCPVNTVKTRLFHARAKLQKLLPALGGSGAETGSGSDA